MFNDTLLGKVLEEEVLPREVAVKLLTLYLGEADWPNAIETLYNRLDKKGNSKKEAKRLTREAISFAVLLPAYDRSTKVDKYHPENLLFWGMSFHQFEKKDWFVELKKVVKRDAEITEWRKEIVSLGVIDPVDYQPYTRQAYKWICDRAHDSGVELTEDIIGKFKKLVMIYGGAVISYIFTKHENVIERKVVNWRSGYFIERAIFEVYDKDQVLEIKKQELRKTNPKWIKEIIHS